jgi:hypothetical protein
MLRAVTLQGDTLTANVLGGIVDLFVFTGPTFKDVGLQYAEVCTVVLTLGHGHHERSTILVSRIGKDSGVLIGGEPN